MDCRFYGSKPYKAVAIHGGPGAPGSASSLAAGLSRLAGAIEPFQTASTVSGQVEELARQIRESTDKEVDVFGHSWGAWITFMLTYKHPELVRKAFLIGSGAFEAGYVEDMNRRRLSRLSPSDREEYCGILERLSNVSSDVQDTLLARLGEITAESDNYDVEDIPENRDDVVRIDGLQYGSVWTEGARMREEGFFVKIAEHIIKPVRVIHGSNDPTPIEGVVDPIKARIRNLLWYEIPECGHSPWKEKHGKDLFWQIISSEMK